MDASEHLQNRPLDWESATDQEVVSALTDRQPFVDPRWMNYVQRNRPHCLRESLLFHEAMGGYLGPPALRFLGRRRR